MSSSWYLRDAEEVEGPFSEPEIRARLLADAFASQAEVKQGNSEWRRASDVKEMFVQVYRIGWYIKTQGKIVGPFLASKVLHLHQMGRLPPDAMMRQGTTAKWMRAVDGIGALEGKQVALAEIAKLGEIHHARTAIEIPTQSTRPENRPVKPRLPTDEEVSPVMDAIVVEMIETPVEVELVREVFHEPGVAVARERESASVNLPPMNHSVLNQPYSPRPSRRRRPGSLALFGWLVAAGFLLGFVVLFVQYRPAINGLMAKLPGFDSHEMVLDDYENLLLHQPAVITIVDARQSPVDAMQDRKHELRRLLNRAVQLGPMSSEEYGERMSRFRQRLQTHRDNQMRAAKELSESIRERSNELSLARESSKQAADQTPPKIEVPNQNVPSRKRTEEEIREYLKASRETQDQIFRVIQENELLALSLTHAINELWHPVPEPESDIERVEQEIVFAQREVLLAAMNVQTQTEYERFSVLVENTQNELQEVLSQNESTIRGQVLFGVNSPFSQRGLFNPMNGLLPKMASVYSEKGLSVETRDYLSFVRSLRRRH
ncbi:DUF4339 domain-containing protein [Rhodopirellula bahusiensis]|uniref:DUF4339 domain-containing protein n=2 Tax=Pseudomonadati TaxID=3379134 RepID=UPI00326461BA